MRKARVLILGTFHMANPGQDIVNLEVDDMLAPKRQAEIAEVVKELARHAPTKVAVEAPVGSAEMRARYRAYVAGSFVATANETYQLGFRLAARMGHADIHPIDVEGEFPYAEVQRLAERTGKTELLHRTVRDFKRLVARQRRNLAAGTVLDVLRKMNAPRRVAADHALYMRLAAISAEGDYAGPDLLAAWYRRNVRIFANLRNIVESPEDRVVAVYGAGHAYWLRRLVRESDDLILENL